MSSICLSVRCSIPMNWPLALSRADDLVQLGLHGRRIAVLRVLDEEHHQERYDGSAGVDDKLPSVRPGEKRTVTPQMTTTIKASRNVSG